MISNEAPFDVCQNVFSVTQEVTDISLQLESEPIISTPFEVVPDLSELWDPCGYFTIIQSPLAGDPFTNSVDVTYTVIGLRDCSIVGPNLSFCDPLDEATVTVVFESLAPIISDCPTEPYVLQDSTCSFPLLNISDLISVESFCEPYFISMVPNTPSDFQGPGLARIELTVTDACGEARCHFDAMLVCSEESNTLTVACPALVFQDENCVFNMPDLTPFLEVVSICGWGIKEQSIPFNTPFPSASPQQDVVVTVTNSCGQSQTCLIPFSLKCDPNGGSCILSHVISAPIQAELITNQLVQFTTGLGVLDPLSSSVTNIMSYAYDTNHFQFLSSIPQLTDIGGLLIPNPDQPLAEDQSYSILCLTLAKGVFTNTVFISQEGQPPHKALPLSGSIITTPFLTVTAEEFLQEEADCSFEIPDLASFPNLINISSSHPAGIASQSPAVGDQPFLGGGFMSFEVTVTNAYFSEVVIITAQIQCATAHDLYLEHENVASDLGEIEIGDTVQITITFSNSSNTSVIPTQLIYTYDPDILAIEPPLTGQSPLNGSILFEEFPQVDPGETLEWTFPFIAIGNGKFTNTVSLLIPDGSEITDSAIGNVVRSQNDHSISGSAWLDYNSNGLRDPNEVALQGILVQVFNEVNSNVLSQITAYNGQYKFSLPEGKYYLDFNYSGLVPGVELQVTRSNFTDLNRNNDVDLNGKVFVTNSSSKVIDLGLSFLWSDVKLSHTVYAGHDGGNGCSGASQIIIDSSAPVTYCFSVLNSGTAPLTNLVISSSRLGVSQNQPELFPGETFDFHVEYFTTGMLASAASVTAYDELNDENVHAISQAWVSDVSNRQILGRIVKDTNNNGTADASESGYSGLSIELRNSAGQPIQTTFSQENGDYKFTGLGSGSYYLMVELTPGLSFGDEPGFGLGHTPIDLGSANLVNVNSFIVPSMDADGDGLPDDWEISTGQSSAQLDPDGDGQTNFEEFLSGTDPSDSSSTFNISAIRWVIDGVEIDFQAQATRSYILESYNKVNGAEDGWIQIQTNILGKNGMLTVLDSTGSEFVRWRKYRISIQP